MDWKIELIAIPVTDVDRAKIDEELPEQPGDQLPTSKATVSPTALMATNGHAMPLL